MPLYKFKNTKTGRVYDKFLSFDEHEKYIKQKNIIQVPTGFKVGNLIHPKENKMREGIWNMAQKYKSSPDWKDNRG